MTTELLGFAASWVGDEESFVILNQEFFEFSLAGLVMVLLVEGNHGLGNSLADSEELGGWTTTTYADTDVKVFESVCTEEENGLEHFQTEGCGLKELKGLSVNFDKASTSGCVSNSGCVLFSAEALYLFCF